MLNPLLACHWHYHWLDHRHLYGRNDVGETNNQGVRIPLNVVLNQYGPTEDREAKHETL
jgi:hypothetical protein